jgi:two-component system, OmpR family, sensor histidine kinase MtrB
MYRFRRLVVDLLDISRADGGYEGARERVEVGDLVRRAADAAAGRPVTVVEPGARGVAMYADKRRLERVLTNLVENAETHGGGCREVRVCAEDHIVRVVVDDLGPGVPPDRRDRIFDRFARDGTSPGTGVGLGLAIVARHVHWHGGEVRVGEAPGGGARFVVDLPLGP